VLERAFMLALEPEEPPELGRYRGDGRLVTRLLEHGERPLHAFGRLLRASFEEEELAELARRNRLFLDEAHPAEDVDGRSEPVLRVVVSPSHDGELPGP